VAAESTDLVAWVGRVLDVPQILTERPDNFHQSVDWPIVIRHGVPDSFGRSAWVQPEPEDACHRASWRGGVGRRIRGYFQGKLGAFVQVKSELESSCLTTRFLEESGGPGGVGPNTRRPALADLHSSGRELDESLKQFGGRSPAAVRMPEQFPALMGLPVISRIEQRDSPQVGR